MFNSTSQKHNINHKHTLNLIYPTWQAPKNITAFTTLAIGGYSTKPYASYLFDYGLNLASHVNDSLTDVIQNRNLLNEILPCNIIWLEQVHGTYCINLDNIYFKTSNLEKFNYFNIRADASFTQNTKLACAVITADCIPLLITNISGSAVMAIHAGWKGLSLGIIEKSLEYFIHQSKSVSQDIIIWLGPAISKLAFRVGNDVFNIFMQTALSHEKQLTKQAFNFTNSNIYADLYSLARIRIHRLEIPYANITGGEFCTYFDYRFYSYRRTNCTGRIASIIYINN